MFTRRNYETNYEEISGLYDDDDAADQAAENAAPFHAPDPTATTTSTRWNHVENLDEFFTRVYKFHQKRGFLCILLGDALDLLQFLFVMTLTSFLAECVDYAILFGEKEAPSHHHHHPSDYNHTKITISDCVKTCSIHEFHSLTQFCLVIAGAFWVFRLIKVLYHLHLYLEIRSFYASALGISGSDVLNMTWHEVQKRLILVQKEQQICIHKSDLTQLDIYHRILRFKNYTVAMVNKNVLPVKFQVPLAGECVFLTTGYRYNLDMILFWGPWAPFANSYHLKDDFKNSHKRKELAEELSKKIFYIGIANFVLCPVILLWQILYSFYNYAEMIKREPGFFGARSWSHFGTVYLRHFNELDHELVTRLSRGYKAASRYMAIFLSHSTTVISKSFAFFCGSILSVLVILTVIDEDVLAVEHVLTLMTCLAAVVTITRSFIPDEHLIWCPEKLLTTVLSHIHYMPDSWKGNAHTWQTRDEFSQLFQYKFVRLIEELLSPIVTPFILCFGLRYKAQDIVDFYRNFTVDVVGVGDVCSFAQMDVRRHGSPEWKDPGKINSVATQYEQAEDGKTELSLMHFHLTNPDWKPPEDCSIFITNVKDHAQKEAALVGNGVTDAQETALFDSLQSLSSVGPGYNQSYMYSSIMTSAHQSATDPASSLNAAAGAYEVSFRLPQQQRTGAHSTAASLQIARGHGVHQNEGPLAGGTGILSSLRTSPHGASMIGSTVGAQIGQARTDALQKEMALTDMGVSAVYMHELRFRRKHHMDYSSVRGSTQFERDPSVPPQSGETGHFLRFDPAAPLAALESPNFSRQTYGSQRPTSQGPHQLASASQGLPSQGHYLGPVQHSGHHMGQVPSSGQHLGQMPSSQGLLRPLNQGFQQYGAAQGQNSLRPKENQMETLDERLDEDSGPSGLDLSESQLSVAPLAIGTSVSLNSSTGINGLPTSSRDNFDAESSLSTPLRLPFLQQQTSEVGEFEEPRTLSPMDDLFKSLN